MRRTPGQSGFTKLAAQILVGADGTFEWGRKAAKRDSVHVATEDGATRSNRVVIPAR